MVALFRRLVTLLYYARVYYYYYIIIFYNVQVAIRYAAKTRLACRSYSIAGCAPMIVAWAPLLDGDARV